MRRSVAALLMLVAGCQAPPQSAYVGISGGEKPAAQTAVGTNAAGEACTESASGARAADIFCGTWQQPSAHVAADDTGGGDLAAAAATGPWRDGIDARLQCDPPAATTILGGQLALVLNCVRRVGGWPQVALVANVRGTIWRGDSVLPAATVMERTIGVLSGLTPPGAAPPESAADGLLAGRLAARAFRSGDVGLFDQLMVAGTRANLAGDAIDSEAAFRAALALQRKALGSDDPNTVAALLPLAVQLSNQARYAEADAVFTQAQALVGRASDETAPARLLHYQALHAKNQGRPADALALLTRAEAGYAALVPGNALQARPEARVFTTRIGQSGQSAAPSVTARADMVADPTGQLALIGVIETRRNRAPLLRALGRVAEGDAAAQSALDLAEANGIARPILTGRLYRTIGVAATSAGDGDAALSDLSVSARQFDATLPGSKTFAETELLRAGELQRAGRAAAALAACRAAIPTLIALKTGTSPSLIAPCLDAFAAAADDDPASRQALLAEMFVASQLSKGSITSEQIAQATARLRESARAPNVANAIRAWQDAGDALAELYRQRDKLAALLEQGKPAPDGETQADLDKRIAAGQAAVAEADTALQAASPNFGQLVQQVVPARDVLATLRPDEAFAAITLSDTTGWLFLLRAPDSIAVARIEGGTGRIAGLVRRLRDGIEATVEGVPPFDIAASQELYAATLGKLPLAGTRSLVVAPTGPLLSVPFAVLLTGPASSADLAGAPWLIRQAAITHVPSAANFVTLRKAGQSNGTHPWFGFGGFRPVTLDQARATFPKSACADSAQLFASLPPLPSAERELDAARTLLGAAPSDEMLDAAFTADAVLRAHLKDYRVLHFATHALLPAELRCENEAAIVTSAPSNARDASGALLSASEVVGLDLDANLIILSACNSGGPGGTTAGESLSGLARAFFYAGSRSMMVTHWSVNDQAAALLVADTLRRQRESPGLGIAAAMQAAELGMLSAAGHSLPADMSHPFYWAPFAVIGDGGGGLGGQRAAL